MIFFYSPKRFSILIFLTSGIPLKIQHAIPSGQKMRMNTAFQVFIVSSFELVLQTLLISLLMRAIIPFCGNSLFTSFSSQWIIFFPKENYFPVFLGLSMMFDK